MAKARKKVSSFHGAFAPPNGRSVFGEVLIKGPSTMLKLKSASSIGSDFERRHLHGVSVDNDYVTCVDCIHAAEGHRTQGGVTTYYRDVFPHYVVVGGAHLDPDAPVITSISFTTTDLNTLFYDRDVFGYINNPSSIMDAVLTEKRKTRSIELGEWPQVHYYTGKDTALNMDSVIGNLVVGLSLHTRMGGMTGIRVKSDRRLTIKPLQPINFAEAIARLGIVRRFLSLAAGRPQEIAAISIVTTAELTQMSPLCVHWTFAPKGPRGNPSQPHSFDLPFDPIDRSDEFVKVMQNWIARDDRMLIPRARLLMGMQKGSRYDPDRLVAAANMFDLLPQDSCPKDVPLPPEMAQFKKEAKAILKAKDFPKTDAQRRALGDMGRWGKASLTDKVLHRWAMASKDVPHLFADMNYVLKLAVKCRNHFVHGPSKGFTFERAEPFLSLFTDALEFVFAFADLVDAGWNPADWQKRHYSDGHMFTRFRWMYPQIAPQLKAAMKEEPMVDESGDE